MNEKAIASIVGAVLVVVLALIVASTIGNIVETHHNSWQLYYDACMHRDSIELHVIKDMQRHRCCESTTTIIGPPIIGPTVPGPTAFTPAPESRIVEPMPVPFPKPEELPTPTPARPVEPDARDDKEPTFAPQSERTRDQATSWVL